MSVEDFVRDAWNEPAEVINNLFTNITGTNFMNDYFGYSSLLVLLVASFVLLYIPRFFRTTPYTYIKIENLFLKPRIDYFEQRIDGDQVVPNK